MLKRTPAFLILAGVVAVFGVGVFLNRTFYHDDTFISLRYCHNLLQGHGLTWNPSERVEGYTNLLFILLTAALGSLGTDLLTAARAVNFAALVALVAFLLWFLHRRTPRTPEVSRAAVVGIPVLAVATSFPLIIWCWGALEGPLFALLTGVGVCLVTALLEDRGGPATALVAGAAFGLSAMTRPDGVIFVVVAMGFLVVFLLGKAPRRIGPPALFVGAFAALVVPHALWRLSYYGQWLPNTFYAKSTGLLHDPTGAGLRYVLDYCTTPPCLLPIAVLLLPVALTRRSARSGTGYLFASVAVYVAFVAYIGGDHMPGFRFLIPVIAPCALLLHRSLGVLLRGASATKVLGACAASVALVSLQMWSLGGVWTDPAGVVGRIVGRYIAEHWPAGSLVALNTAGTTPYTAPQHRYIDMLGINDAHIARRKIKTHQVLWQGIPGHAKGDGAYVLSRKPDFIILGPAQGTTIGRPWFLSDLELGRQREFRRAYRRQVAHIDVSEVPGHGQFAMMESGTLKFVYYQRVQPK